METRDKGNQARQEKLKSRVKQLSQELDNLEYIYEKTGKLFQETVKVLTGLGSSAQNKEVKKGIKSINKALSAKRVDPDKLKQAIQQLKDTLLAQEEPEVLPKVSEGANQAGRHVALALLSGLRMGTSEYDRNLEQTIGRISSCIDKGMVRPAMAMVVDVIAEYRAIAEERRLKAEKALTEIYKEVLKADQDMSQLFVQTQNTWIQTGNEFDQQVTKSVGQLAEGLKQGDSLDLLKQSVLTHVKILRNTIKERKTQEQDLMEKTQAEMGKLRSDLEKATKKIHVVQEVSKRLGKEANTDPMTGVLNKRAFSRLLDHLMEVEDKHPVSLIVFDIDKFKRINDNYGHKAGDRALSAIAEQASSKLRNNDVLFRYAGDEFVILLPNTKDKDAVNIAERVRKSAESISFSYKGSSKITITISLGISQLKANDTAETFFERADKALLQAKEQGRNRVNIM